MPCLGQAGCVPWGSQGFCRCLFLRVKTGCFLRVKTIYRAFEGSEVAGRKPGQVAGNPAARSGGSSPCVGRSFLRDRRLCGSLAPTPEFSVQPAPRGPFPPAGNRQSPAGAAGRPRPWPRNLRSPGSRCGSRPARRCLETRANTALLAPSLGAQRSCCPAARARGTPGSGCSGPATPTLPKRKSREERPGSVMLLG